MAEINTSLAKMNAKKEGLQNNSSLSELSVDKPSIFLFGDGQNQECGFESDVKKAVFNKSVVDIVDYHSGSYGSINQAIDDGYLDKNKPIKILHFDTHSDLYMKNGSELNIGNYMNYVVSEKNVSDVYWVVPSEAEKTILKSGRENKVAYIYAKPEQKIYINKKLSLEDINKLSYEEPSDYKKKASNYRIVTLHTVTKENLPSFENESNLVLDFDNDYLQNTGHDTVDKLTFLKSENQIDSTANEVVKTLEEKKIKPELTVFAKSHLYSLPEDKKQAAKSYLAMEKFNYSVIENSKEKNDYLSENSYDVFVTNLDGLKTVRTADNQYYKTIDEIKKAKLKNCEMDSRVKNDKQEENVLSEGLAKELKISKNEAINKIDKTRDKNKILFVQKNNEQYVNLNDELYINSRLGQKKFKENMQKYEEGEASSTEKGRKLIQKNKEYFQEYQESLSDYFREVSKLNFSSETNLNKVNDSSIKSVDITLKRLNKFQRSDAELKSLQPPDFFEIVDTSPEEDYFEKNRQSLKKIKKLSELSNSDDIKLLSAESYFHLE